MIIWSPQEDTEVKGKVLVFGGTTEGRILSDYLRDYCIPHEVSVATEYGRDILAEKGEDKLLVGRKDRGEIEKVIKDGSFTIVVDATHPFATVVSEEIKGACDSAKVRYLRLKRDTGKELTGRDDIIYADTLKEAVSALAAISGNILLLTGSKDLQDISDSFHDVSRLYARVLPNEESIGKCVKAGLSGKQIIAMQGPFSRQMNVATIKEINASAIFTKESGRTGGLSEKLEAALECGIKAVVLKNPENKSENSEGYSLEEVLQLLAEHCEIEIVPQKNITLAGIGPGGEEFYTRELTKELEIADVIFGAQAVIRNLSNGFIKKFHKETPIIPEYSGEKIYEYLEENSEFKHPLVLFSGDISLCSGAKKVSEYFRDRNYKIKRICGISSVTFLAERLELSLEKVRIVSAHGRQCNVRGYVAQNEEVIILPSDADHAREICSLTAGSSKIIGMSESVAAKAQNTGENMVVTVGCDLGTTDEKILKISEKPELAADISGKCLIYVKNLTAVHQPVAHGLSDDEIIRGKAPMTKEEIRALSMRKLALTGNAVFYDIGAGTGSVSLEAALLSPDIKVYAIEKKDEAVALLQQNKEKFGADNIEIIHGEAPEALDLPAPTHVFIGGSGGNMGKILATVFTSNESARIVINAVTAETFAEIMECLRDYPNIEPDIIQVFACRYKKAGSYHLADALNPVYIITLQKGEKHDRD